ncbi:MAG: DUF1015 domain-containing protein [Fibrobacterota bacterium]
MSEIKPFRALRPPRDMAAEVSSLPYDVMNSEEAAKMASDNPASFLHVIKPEIDLPSDEDHYSSKVYSKGKENLENFKTEGYLRKDEKESFYVYRQVMKGRAQTGIFFCASVDEYQNGLIKKHELTREEKENDRAKHVDTLGANTGPVFLTFRPNQSVSSILNRISQGTPDFDFTASDGIKHTLWTVSKTEDIDEIIKAFDSVPCLYVADGHHRSASASRVREIRRKNNPDHTGKEEYNYFLTAAFPSDELEILDYNRVLKDLNGLSEDEFIEKISDKFEISEANSPNPPERHSFCMYLSGKWHLLRAKDGSFDENHPVESLDVSILQENLLAPVLSIGDPRTDNRIDFVGGIRGTAELEKLVDEGKFKTAFAMYPTSIDELMNIADTDMIMPPKSTWFEPKLRSGLVVHEF